MSEKEGELKKRKLTFREIVKQECSYSCWLGEKEKRATKPDRTQEFVKIDVIDEAQKEYPKVSQKWVPVKGKRVDWKTLCKMMELKIIEFENFGKKWFGVGEKANAESQKKIKQK